MKDIVVNNISKAYDKGAVIALDSLSFEVDKGELFGLIGPDGAGKTTLFRILTTLLLADKGNASVAGFDVVRDYRKIRNCVGYMPGRFSLYQDLTVKENLTFFATLFNTTIEKNYYLIKNIYDQIKPFENRRAGKLSGGMKQKLALSCALIHKPSVLFLDEPTTGVDVVSRREFWEMLRSLKESGITILVSTPYMEEAILCERIGLIQKGKMLGIDTPDKIIQAYPERLFAIKANDIYRLLQELRHCSMVTSCNAFGEWLHITISGAAIEAVEQFALQNGHTDVEVKVIEPTIEDSFIRLMGNETQNDSVA